jgi:hypothetical protein
VTARQFQCRGIRLARNGLNGCRSHEFHQEAFAYTFFLPSNKVDSVVGKVLESDFEEGLVRESTGAECIARAMRSATNLSRKADRIDKLTPKGGAVTDRDSNFPHPMCPDCVDRLR